MSKCYICPRRCGSERQKAAGFCGEGAEIRVSRIAPHRFEEPPISGVRGSGTVFFSGCSLHCVYCQNKDISRVGGKGQIMTSAELHDAILALQESGVHNINLVTAAHFADALIPILERLRAGELKIPVVYNSSGYESVDTLRRFDGLVDIYLPDFKYASAELAQKYSGAPDYPRVATAALTEMLRQTDKYVFDGEGMLSRGTVVRHLVLPSHRADSLQVLNILKENLGCESILLSLMSQYTPDFALDSPHTELHRRVTTFEYASVAKAAEAMGFEGFIQERSSAKAAFTPEF